MSTSFLSTTSSGPVDLGTLDDGMWTELIGGMKLVIDTEEGPTGTRTFLKRLGPCTTPDGMRLRTLPKLGDKFESDGVPSVDNCVLKTIDYSYFNEDINVIQAVCTYSSKPRDSIDTGSRPDKLPRNISLSPNWIQFLIAKDSGLGDSFQCPDGHWTGPVGNRIWVAGPTKLNLINENLDKPLAVHIQAIAGNMTISQKVKNLDTTLGYIADTIGKVNEVEFMGLPPQCVLYGGADSREYFNEWGARRWEVSHKFQVQMGNAGLGLNPNSGVLIAGFNHIFRPDIWRWDYLYYNDPNEGDSKTYKLVNFQQSLHLSLSLSEP